MLAKLLKATPHNPLVTKVLCDVTGSTAEGLQGIREKGRSYWEGYWPELQLLPSFVSKLNPCTCQKQSSLLLNTARALLHFGRPCLVQPNPAQYCTYYCEPLSLLICFQTGRPGRKPWRGSCVKPSRGRKRRETVKRWKEWKQSELVFGNAFYFCFTNFKKSLQKKDVAGNFLGVKHECML